MGQWGGQGEGSYLAVQTDGEEHKEEEDGPQWGDGQLGHRLRVHHKRQTGTCNKVRQEYHTGYVINVRQGTPQTSDWDL